MLAVEVTGVGLTFLLEKTMASKEEKEILVTLLLKTGSELSFFLFFFFNFILTTGQERIRFRSVYSHEIVDESLHCFFVGVQAEATTSVGCHTVQEESRG